MDRKYSYNWIKEYVDSKLSAREFAQEFSLKSQTIDRVHEFRPKFMGVVTARITDIKPHPNANKLQIAVVDAGRGGQEIVCGAPNIAVGQVVPLAREGATVLAGKGNIGETMTIRKTEIRGVVSDGMLCSLFELGISDDHAGMWVLPSDTPIGKHLESVAELNDDIFEIEITSNRP